MNRKTCDLKIGFSAINKLILEGFYSRAGPGELPVDKRDKILHGMIVPGYSYGSSSIALAWAYKELAESQLPDVYIILGRDIFSKNMFSTYLFSRWETCFGVVKVDENYGRELIKLFPLVRNSAEAFKDNTFIDWQLPMLQFSNKNSLDRIYILPILVGNATYEDICSFADVVSDSSKNICVIASANLTYYGKGHDAVPFVYGVKHGIALKDQEFLGHINRLGTKGFLESAKKWNVPDKNVIVLFMEIMRGFGLLKGKLLCYYTSGDIEGYENSVSFASLVF